MAREVGSSHWFPKVIVPRQISETFKPVRPKRLMFIVFSSSLLLIVCLLSVWQVPCSLTTGSSLEEKVQHVCKSREVYSLSGGNYRHPETPDGRIIVENDCLIL